MSCFVLDASMALAWHFRDEGTPRTRAISAMSDEVAVVVPTHWFAEVANGLLIGERQRRATGQDSARFADRLRLLDVDIDALASEEFIGRILPLARAHGLTVYDTLYLELAERRGLPLASLDKQLNDAARRTGVVLVEEME